MVLLVIFALGPANWTPRTPLGWQFDHFIGYFAITLMVCIGWPRPTGMLLETLQAFTPDRTANVVAALCCGGGALAAALVAEFFRKARVHAQSFTVNQSGEPMPVDEVRVTSGSQ
jgi:VanZ family protein